MEVKMVARHVGVGNDRAVVELHAVRDHTDDQAAGGHASIHINNPDDLDAFKEGALYVVSFAESSEVHTDSDAWLARTTMQKEVAAIPNSTNTRGYVTPPEMKATPPFVPEGVVTMPRPSVILPPAPGSAPPDAGVASGAGAGGALRSDAWAPTNPDHPPHPPHPPHPATPHSETPPEPEKPATPPASSVPKK